MPSNRLNTAFSPQSTTKQSFICDLFGRPLAIGPKDEVANPSIRQVLVQKTQIVVLVWLLWLRREPDQFDNFIPSGVRNDRRIAQCRQFSKLFGAASAIKRPEERLIIPRIVSQRLYVGKQRCGLGTLIDCIDHLNSELLQGCHQGGGRRANEKMWANCHGMMLRQALVTVGSPSAKVNSSERRLVGVETFVGVETYQSRSGQAIRHRGDDGLVVCGARLMKPDWPEESGPLAGTGVKILGPHWNSAGCSLGRASRRRRFCGLRQNIVSLAR